MIFQHRFIIVHQSQLRTCHKKKDNLKFLNIKNMDKMKNVVHTCIDEVLIGQSWMINIVNWWGKDCSHYFQWCEHILQKWLLYSQFNLLNDYTAKISLGLFNRNWWRFFCHSIVYRGLYKAPADLQRHLYLSNNFGTKWIFWHLMAIPHLIVDALDHF